MVKLVVRRPRDYFFQVASIRARILGCGSFKNTFETIDSFKFFFETIDSFKNFFETIDSFKDTFETIDSFKNFFETIDSFKERAGAPDFSRACQSDFQSPNWRKQDSTVAQALHTKWNQSWFSRDSGTCCSASAYRVRLSRLMTVWCLTTETETMSSPSILRYGTPLSPLFLAFRACW